MAVTKPTPEDYSPDPAQTRGQRILPCLPVIVGIVTAVCVRWLFVSPVFRKATRSSKSPEDGALASRGWAETAAPGARDNPVKKRASRVCLWLPVILAIAGSYWLLQLVVIGVPQSYGDNSMHFKYGSIGSDNLRRGIPYDIWRVLPDIFSDHLEGKAQSYEAFGLITDQRDQEDRPIGFSKRWHLGVGEVIGLNCAFCHVSTLRNHPNDKPKIILGMPANTVDAEGFFQFLFKIADDPQFNVEDILAAINQKREKSHEERLGYWETFIQSRIVIPSFIRGLKNLKHTFSFLDRRPTPFGPGRVDTWAAYKVLILQEPVWFMEYFPEQGRPSIDMDAGPVTGLADFPPLWRVKPAGSPLHWDGNTTDPEERNITAALGAGVTPATLDTKSLKRIAGWMDSSLKPVPYHELAPKFPATTETHGLTKVIFEQGKHIFKHQCYDCHAEEGARIRSLEPIDVDDSCRKDIETAPLIQSVDVDSTKPRSCEERYIGTDPARLHAFTKKLSDKLNEVRHVSLWKFKDYRKTYGYANMLLTGIWLRAPYLHNGSVPTLWHLLQKPEDRPKIFCRGNDVYDWKMVGFEWTFQKLGEKETEMEDCNAFHSYDTTLPGNGNGGHVYGTDLSDQEKEALIEYLKTL